MAYYRMAEMYEEHQLPQITEEQSYEKAIKYYNKSAQIDPGFIPGNIKLRSLQMQRSHWSEVLTSLLFEVLEFFVTDWGYLFRLFCILIIINVLIYWVIRALS